ncbi:hypothetical protein Dimus_012044 [Dionaea muscipula]
MASCGGDILPFVVMVAVQLGNAGLNIIVKMAMNDGMDPLVLIAYRQLFAVITIAPLTYFLERKHWSAITKEILFHIFLYSLFGLESVGIKSRSGQAKVFGTLLCVGGSMILSFYHGETIGIKESPIKWKYNSHTASENTSNNFLGPFLLLASTISGSVWLVLQEKMGQDFTAPCTNTALMCFMASIQCFPVAGCSQHNAAKWSIIPGIKLMAILYAGIISSAINYSVMTWTVQEKGALYVSLFTPLGLIFVTILSWALLSEQLYVGTAVGSFLIVVGLYVVLWGKKKDQIIMTTCEEDFDIASEEDVQVNCAEEIKTTQV